MTMKCQPVSKHRNQFKLAQSIDSQMISMGKYVRRLAKSYKN